jgi:membrane-bound lytic murein transglycosylase D
MVSRPIIAAAGLFFAGVVVGSAEVGRTGKAQAATETRTDAENKAAIPPRRDRGPVAPALRKASGLGDAVGDGAATPGQGTRYSLPRVGGDVSRRDRDRDLGDPNDPFRGLRLPELPVPKTPEVLKFIRYYTENRDGRKDFAEAIRRSGRFQDLISKTFRELGLPTDLMAVALVESGFSTEAFSSAGAVGLWQFMPSTGRAYGLAVENQLDERLSAWRSTEAAARHFEDLYERFRSWDLALAAYDLGYDGLERRLDERETDDFWTLAETPGALPQETVNYVPKVLAAAVVLANLDVYGFGDVDRAQPLDASELEVAGGTKLSTVARAAGTSLRVLRDLNPELLVDAVPDRGEPRVLHVPRSGLSRARTMLPKLGSADSEPRVSDDFDWGKDDVRAGRSRLERSYSSASATGYEPRSGERGASRSGGLIQRVHHRLFGRAEPAKVDKSRSRDATSDDVEREPKRLAPDLEPPERNETPPTRVLYRVVAGESLQQIASTVGLTVDQLLAQAHIKSAEQLSVGTLLDLRVPAPSLRSDR